MKTEASIASIKLTDNFYNGPPTRQCMICSKENIEIERPHFSKPDWICPDCAAKIAKMIGVDR